MWAPRRLSIPDFSCPCVIPQVVASLARRGASETGSSHGKDLQSACSRMHSALNNASKIRQLQKAILENLSGSWQVELFPASDFSPFLKASLAQMTIFAGAAFLCCACCAALFRKLLRPDGARAMLPEAKVV